MARYTDADCKRCRREKTKLFLKGSKCDSPKCPFEKRPYPPGQHGRGRLSMILQLLEWSAPGPNAFQAAEFLDSNVVADLGAGHFANPDDALGRELGE